MDNEIDSSGFGYRKNSIVTSVAVSVTGLIPGKLCDYIQRHFHRVARDAHHRIGSSLFGTGNDVTNPTTPDNRSLSPQTATNLESALIAALPARNLRCL